MTISVSNNIVFTPMSVDPLHHGHIIFLRKIEHYAPIVVGLMTDEAIKAYKDGSLLNYKQRFLVLSELRCVSKIIPVDSLKDVVKVAASLKPKYFAHGKSWSSLETRQKVIEVLKTWGGELIEVPRTKGVSSTIMRKNILKDL